MASGDHGERFFVRENGRRAITPLFLVLLVIESTDVRVRRRQRAGDLRRHPGSVHRFHVEYFCHPGTAGPYFLLAGVMDLFRYLNYGLAAILVFVGLKMIAEYRRPAVLRRAGGHIISPLVSLLIIVVLLAASIVASLMAGSPEDAIRSRREHRRRPGHYQGQT